MTKVTDLSYLKEVSSDNKVFLKQMIEIFLKQTPGLISGLQDAFIKKDLPEFRKIFHKIKPSFSMIGIQVLEHDIKKIDDALKKGIEMDKLPALLKRLEDVCNRSYDELRAELKSL